MAESSGDFRSLLATLEGEMRRLETEFTQFFAGRRPRPPWELRTRVRTLVQQLDRVHVTNYGDRYRFSSLQARVMAMFELWDRQLRAKEEGRAGAPGAGQGERGGDRGGTKRDG